MFSGAEEEKVVGIRNQLRKHGTRALEKSFRGLSRSEGLMRVSMLTKEARPDWKQRQKRILFAVL